MVLSCCTVAFVGLSPAPKTASALAPLNRDVLIFSMMFMMMSTPNGAHTHTEDEALAPLPSPPSPAPPHGSAPPVQALVARALQEIGMVNQTPWALTVMAPKRSAPVPLKVYQASFVVKVRDVPAQPSAAPSPLPQLSRQCGPCRAKLQHGKQQSSTTSSVAQFL